MTIEECNAYLDALAQLNDGLDHSSEYSLEVIPGASSLFAALQGHFSAVLAGRDPPEPSWDWDLSLDALGSEWKSTLEAAIDRWFFQQAFSPKVVHDHVRRNVVVGFLERLQTLVGGSTAYRIQTYPPIWYGCQWEDYAFEAQGNVYVLHFGFFD